MGITVGGDATDCKILSARLSFFILYVYVHIVDLLCRKGVGVTSTSDNRVALACSIPLWIYVLKWKTFKHVYTTEIVGRFHTEEKVLLFVLKHSDL